MTEEQTEHLRVHRRRQIELDRRCCHQFCYDVCSCQKRHALSASIVFRMFEVHHQSVKTLFSKKLISKTGEPTGKSGRDAGSD